jgi:hypothetical protein
LTTATAVTNTTVTAVDRAIRGIAPKGSLFSTSLK